MASRHIVIVGAGPAGIAAALAASRADVGHRVTVLSAEAGDPYEKPPLSKAVLTDGADPAASPIVPAEALQGIDLRREVTVEAIDRERRLVVHAGGSGQLPYDALVLATGAVTRELPALPAGMPGVFYLRTAADALALRAALSLNGPRPQVAVIGAGLIGLEVAAAAVKLGAAAHVVEATSSAMARLCSPALARLVIDRHQLAGVRFHWRTVIEGVEPDATPMALHLAGGAVVRADVAVVGIGILPNVGLAEAAGLAVDHGIIVDAQGRTSDPAIFAAGDVARFRSDWSPTPVHLENWRHAMEQGEVAGHNAAGGEASYAAVPSWWSEQYELMIQAVGWPDALESPPVRRELGGGRVVEFHLRGGALRYAVGIGAGRDISVARRLIDRRVPVEPAALADRATGLQTLLRANGRT